MQSVDALTLRERLFIFGALLALVAGAWEALLATPLQNREAVAARSIEAASQMLEQLDESISVAAQGMGGGMTDHFDRLQLLRRQVTDGEDSVRIFTSDLVDPAQMRFVLEDLIQRQSKLELLSARNLESRPLIDQDSRDGETMSGNGPMLYRHGLVLEVQGNYLDFLAYLEAVERLPWQLYWSRLQVETLEHPRLHISIEMHTLSLDEEWIGV